MPALVRTAGYPGTRVIPGTLVRFEPASHRIARIRLDDVVDLATDGDQAVFRKCRFGWEG